jgi:Na+-driven multidrug efflux pump
VKVSDIKDGFGGFFKQGLVFIVGMFVEVVGFEFNTYQAGMTHDQDQIAAFVAWVNFGGIMFMSGLGFANVTRQRVSNYVGANRKTQARNAAVFFQSICIAIGLVCVTLVLSFRNYIPRIYTPLPVIQNLLSNILIGYGIVCFLDCGNGGMMTLMRITGRANLLTLLTFSFYGLSLAVMSYLLSSVAGLGVKGLVLSFIMNSIMLNGVYYWLINFRTDWSKVKGETNGPEVEEQSNEEGF